MTTKATCSSRYNHFFANNPLYDSVFTQYGPFYFETMRFLFAVASVEVGHDAGRIVTLAFWIAAALHWGWRRSLPPDASLYGLAGQLIAFTAPFVMVE
jgi:hypothetical protein